MKSNESMIYAQKRTTTGKPPSSGQIQLSKALPFQEQ
jgi:hypothetical protein